MPRRIQKVERSGCRSIFIILGVIAMVCAYFCSCSAGSDQSSEKTTATESPLPATEQAKEIAPIQETIPIEPDSTSPLSPNYKVSAKPANFNQPQKSTALPKGYEDGYEVGYEDGSNHDRGASYAPKQKTKKYLKDYEDGYSEGWYDGFNDYREDYDGEDDDEDDEW